MRLLLPQRGVSSAGRKIGAKVGSLSPGEIEMAGEINKTTELTRTWEYWADCQAGGMPGVAKRGGMPPRAAAAPRHAKRHRSFPAPQGVECGQSGATQNRRKTR